jgi:hypothetical protein
LSGNDFIVLLLGLNATTEQKDETVVKLKVVILVKRFDGKIQEPPLCIAAHRRVMNYSDEVDNMLTGLIGKRRAEAQWESRCCRSCAASRHHPKSSL